MTRLIFASTNESKFNEILLRLNAHNIDIEFVKLETLEIQSDQLEDIAIQKSIDAFEKITRPLIVEDTGIFIESLKGFPGPYSAYVLATIGNKGILDLLSNRSDRSAFFRSVIAYKDSTDNVVFFGDTKGTISENITEGGWGYDPIFIPEFSSLTYAQLGITNKIAISHRTQALDSFAKWYHENHIGEQEI